MKSFNMQDMMDRFEAEVTELNRQGLTVLKISQHRKPDAVILAKCRYKPNQKKRIAQYLELQRQRDIHRHRTMMCQWHLVPNGPDPWGVADRTDQELHDEVWELANRSYRPPHTVHDLGRSDISFIRDRIFDVTEEQICNTLGIAIPAK
jgi:hypothetical protein